MIRTLGDGYVLPEHRGLDLYRRFAFGARSERVLERRSG